MVRATNTRSEFWAETWRESILAFDPGYTYFRTALRGITSVILSFFAISIVVSHFNQPPTLAFFGVIIAQMSAIVIADATRRQQQITMLILPIPAGLAVTLSILLSPWQEARLIAFLVVTFAIVYIRRFGLRWLALGIITFMSYFAPLFFPIHASAIPWALNALLISCAISYAIRFWVFADRPQRLLMLHLRSFHVRLARVLDRLSVAFEELAGVGDQSEAMLEEHRLHLRRAVVRVNESSLLIEQFLNSSDSNAVRAKAEKIVMSLFEQELAFRKILVRSEELVRGRGLDVQTLHELGLLARRAASVVRSQGNFDAGFDSVSPRVRDFAKCLTAALETVRTCSRGQDAAAGVESEAAIEMAAPGLGVVANAGGAPAASLSLHPATRQAIQATLATALASMVGYAISPERWYWASLTAFLIFAGASRGETLQRAFTRVVGTAGGLATGFVVAYVLSGHKSVEWALVIACVFFGVYGARLAFGFWTATLFSAMIAILFDVIGQFSLHILVLRLEETAIGAVIGALVSAYVLPTSTRATVRKALADLLATMSQVLRELPLRPPAQASLSRMEIVRRLRRVDRDLQALRLAAAPITSRIPIMKQGDLPLILHDAALLAHFLRHLATAPAPAGEAAGDDEVQLSLLKSELAERMSRIAEALRTPAAAAQLGAPELKAPAAASADSGPARLLGGMVSSVSQLAHFAADASASSQGKKPI